MNPFIECLPCSSKKKIFHTRNLDVDLAFVFVRPFSIGLDLSFLLLIVWVVLYQINVAPTQLHSKVGYLSDLLKFDGLLKSWTHYQSLFYIFPSKWFWIRKRISLSSHLRRHLSISYWSFYKYFKDSFFKEMSLNSRIFGFFFFFGVGFWD